VRAAPARARKQFGQHFLEPAWVDKVLRAIDPKTDETFIEIGPGRAALTRPLAARVRAVIAYEIDRDLARELRATAPPNVTIVEGDFLEADPPGLPVPSPRSPVLRFRVAANLPYNVASPILFKLVDWYHAGLPLSDATVMLQREVADRLTAAPGSRTYGVLSVLIGHSATVERVLNLPAGAFRPAPKVQSSVVRLRFHARHPTVKSPQQFEAMVQAVFTRRRKTIANALKAFGDPDRVRLPDWLDGGRRPETLSIEEFAWLADAVEG